MVINNKLIYKVCHKSEWKIAKKIGKFYGSEKDISDGYIHFSSGKQLKSTVKKFFLNQDNLIILEVDPNLVKNLVWEKSHNGLFFPHLYSYLDISSVTRTCNLPIQKNGSRNFSIVFN